MLSPKLGLVLGPWSHTKFYMNAGTGFHSNDARGTTIKIDPTSGDPADRIPFLVRSKGAEIGLRSERSKTFQSTLAAFVLDFDSEIVSVGDAGNTEASRPSRRIGLEYTLQMKLLPWLMFDFEAAYTRARFTEDDPLSPAGRYIPGATEGVLSAGLTFGDPAASGWFGGVKVRYFGPRPLIEDNSVRSKSSTPVSARLGYMFADGLMVRVDGFNLFDQKSSQIDNYYGSRILSAGTTVGTAADDIHFHPLEPRSVRLSVAKQWSTGRYSWHELPVRRAAAIPSAMWSTSDVAGWRDRRVLLTRNCRTGEPIRFVSAAEMRTAGCDALTRAATSRSTPTPNS